VIVLLVLLLMMESVWVVHPYLATRGCPRCSAKLGSSVGNKKLRKHMTPWPPLVGGNILKPVACVAGIIASLPCGIGCLVAQPIVCAFGFAACRRPCWLDSRNHRHHCRRDHVERGRFLGWLSSQYHKTINTPFIS